MSYLSWWCPCTWIPSHWVNVCPSVSLPFLLQQLFFSGKPSWFPHPSSLQQPPWIRNFPIMCLPKSMSTSSAYNHSRFILFCIATQASIQDWFLPSTITISQVLFLHWFYSSSFISSESKQTSSFNLIQSEGKLVFKCIKELLTLLSVEKALSLYFCLSGLQPKFTPSLCSGTCLFHLYP